MSWADSKFRVTNTIRQLLVSDERISNLVGNKIYPLYAPEDVTGDFLLYVRDEYSREYNKMSITSQTTNVYINAVSDDYDRSQELAYLIDDVLSGFHTDLHMEIKLMDSTEDVENKKYIQSLLFSIT